jgi:hypothetical protein
MPHDFYLGFPDNPAIGQLDRAQWIEYDVLGQFFGWGLMPCLALDDLRPRMAHWRNCNVQGVILRIEWERINDLDCLDTLNEINLIAAAAWALGQQIDAVEACRRWLVQREWNPAQADWLAGVLALTTPIVQKAAYIDGFVSADNSMLPRSIARAWWGMEVRDALIPWAPQRAGDLTLDPRKLRLYIEEKEQAVIDTRALMTTIAAGKGKVSDTLHNYVQHEFALFEHWVEGLVLCAKVCLYSRWLEQACDETRPLDVMHLTECLQQLRDYAGRAQALADDPGIPHQRIMLCDPARALDIVRDGEQVIRQLGLPSTH